MSGRDWGHSSWPQQVFVKPLAINRRIFQTLLEIVLEHHFSIIFDLVKD